MARKILINNKEITGADIKIEVIRELSGISRAIISKIPIEKFSDFREYTGYTNLKIIDDGKVYFNGYAKRTSDLLLNKTQQQTLDIEAFEQKLFLSGTKTIDRIFAKNDGFTDGHVQHIIKFIFDDMLTDMGFTLNIEEVPSDYQLDAINLEGVNVYEAFDKLSDIFNLVWFCKENQIIFLNDFTTADKTIPLWDRTDIGMDVTMSSTAEDFYTTVTVQSDLICSNILQSNGIYLGGTSLKDLTSFNLVYPAASIQSIVIRYDSGKTYNATYTSFQDDENKDFHWTPNSSKISKKKVPDLLNASTIMVNYYPYVKQQATVKNKEAIAMISMLSGVNGELNYFEKRNDINTYRDLNNYASSLLNKKSIIELEVKLTAYTPLMTIGDRVFLQFNQKFDVLNVDDNLNDGFLLATTNQLDGLMEGLFIVKEVEEVSMKGLEKNIYESYKYTLTNNYWVKNVSNFWDLKIYNGDAVDLDDVRIQRYEDYSYPIEIVFTPQPIPKRFDLLNVVNNLDGQFTLITGTGAIIQ